MLQNAIKIRIHFNTSYRGAFYSGRGVIFLFTGRRFYKWGGGGAYNQYLLIYLFFLTGSTLSHLIIISRYKMGLQNCLHKLSSKCTS